jgi:hypothetical protein
MTTGRCSLRFSGADRSAFGLIPNEQDDRGAGGSRRPTAGLSLFSPICYLKRAALPELGTGHGVQ